MTEARYGENSLAVIFQGQNSAYPGMGKELNDKFEAGKRVFNLASDVLGYDVRQICYGTRTHLQRRPRWVQPAIVATELAEYRAWQDATDGEYEPDLVTGLSLGMYSALAAAGSAEDSTIFRIVKKRAQLVDRNAKLHPGGMLRITGISHPEKLAELIQRTKTSTGIDWGHHGLVHLTGARDRIMQAEVIANAWENVEVKVSDVAEAAHSHLQRFIQSPLKEVLEEVEINPPQINLLSNDPKDGQRKHKTEYLRTKSQIIQHMLDQLVRPVQMGRINELIVLSGIAKVIEIGPDRDFGLAAQLIRKSREQKIASLRDAMGRKAVRRYKFDYEGAA